MIPHQYGPVLFSLILSGLMSLLVSGIAAFRVAAAGDGLLGLWAAAWMTAWLIAFPAVMVIAPLTRRIVRALVAEPRN